MAICMSQARPSWKRDEAALVDVAAVPQHEAGDVHGQEPAAAQVRGRPER